MERLTKPPRYSAPPGSPGCRAAAESGRFPNALHAARFAKVALGVWMAGVITAAFILAPPARGFRNEALARMLFFHVPNSLVATAASTASAVYAIVYLARRRRMDDIRSKSLATIALLFWFTTTITGAVFAKVQWGAYWNWDPKQSAIFILLLLYLAYFALRAGIADPDKQAVVAAGYTVFAAVTTPFLTYILPNATPDTLHPKGVIFTSGGMDTTYKLIFWSAALGFFGLATWLFDLQVRSERLVLALDRRLASHADSY